MKTRIKTQFKSVINRLLLICKRISSINIIQVALYFDIHVHIYRLLTLLTRVNIANTFGAFDLVVEETEAKLYLLYDEDIIAYLDLSSIVPVSVQDNKIMET